MSDADLAIGEVADACRVTVSAVRYYSDVGLLSISRRVEGKRRFARTTIARVEFIRRCQESGFTLDEIYGILNEDSDRWRSAVDARVLGRLTPGIRAIRSRCEAAVGMIF